MALLFQLERFQFFGAIGLEKTAKAPPPHRKRTVTGSSLAVYQGYMLNLVLARFLSLFANPLNPHLIPDSQPLTDTKPLAITVMNHPPATVIRRRKQPQI